MVTANDLILPILTCLWMTSVNCIRNLNTFLAIKKHLKDYNHSIYIEARNYKELVTKSRMFIDNTLFIEEILNTMSPSTIIVGPRKCGKTMNFRMLQSFLEIQVDAHGNPIQPIENTDNYKLFKNGEIVHADGTHKLETPLAISKNIELFQKHQGRYPVIYVNFENVDGVNDTAVKNSLNDAISEAFQQHKYMIKALEAKMENTTSTLEKKAFQDYRDKFKKALERKFENTDEISVDLLSRILFNHFKRKPFVIFDHYDSPFTNVLRRSAYTLQELEYVSQLMDKIYAKTFKHYANNNKAIAVGTFQIQPMYKNTTWYDLQIHDIISEPHQFIQYFAIDRRNIQQLMEKHQMVKQLEQISQWYAGYQYTTTREYFYNLFSIVNFLKERKVEPYWKPIEDQHILLKKLCSNTREIEDKFLTLLSKQTIVCNSTDPKLITQVEQDLKEPWFKNIFWYLHRLGYLAHDTSSSSEHTLQIPNNEVAHQISNWMISYYLQKYSLKRNLLEDTDICLLNLVNANSSDSGDLKNSLEALYKDYLLQLDESKRHFKKEYLIRSILNCITMKMQLISEFRYEIYYNKILEADIVILNLHEGLGTAVELQLHHKSNENVPNRAHKTYKSLNKFDAIKTIKNINIYLYPNGTVNIDIGVNIKT